MSPYLLGIDSGNTSTKAVVFDEEGYERGVGSVNNKQVNPQPRWVEQDMNTVWENVQAAVREAILAAKIDGGEISAVGMSATATASTCWTRPGAGARRHPVHGL